MTADFLAGDGGTMQLIGKPAGGRTPKDIATALVEDTYPDADLDYEVSRYVLFHRMRSADGKTAQPYVVDPYPHADSRLHTRVGMADLAGLAPSWYLGLTQMQKAVGK